MVVLFLVFLGVSILFSTMVVPIYIPISNVGDSLFSIPFIELIVCRFFDQQSSLLNNHYVSDGKESTLQCRILQFGIQCSVQSLGWKDPLEQEMATHSSILACRILWTEEPGRLYSPWGCKELDMTEQLTYTCVKCIKD